MGKLKSSPKGSFHLLECEIDKANMTMHSLSVTPWEVLIKPCALIEMQGSGWENWLTQYKNSECFPGKQSSAYLM